MSFVWSMWSARSTQAWCELGLCIKSAFSKAAARLAACAASRVGTGARRRLLPPAAATTTWSFPRSSAAPSPSAKCARNTSNTLGNVSDSTSPAAAFSCASTTFTRNRCRVLCTKPYVAAGSSVGAEGESKRSRGIPAFSAATAAGATGRYVRYCSACVSAVTLSSTRFAGDGSTTIASTGGASTGGASTVGASPTRVSPPPPPASPSSSSSSSTTSSSSSVASPCPVLGGARVVAATASRRSSSRDEEPVPK
mmetsp:Transcript_1390/g.4698  ORF Transcript_1390/g.4698 Transcript_1390/m.4698 type:complete len:253 (+) Transcript_1390:2099-2857(+)